MAYVIVERSFESPVELCDIRALEESAAWCFEMHGTHLVHTLFSKDGRRMICLYEAPDTESVRDAQREAGVPFDQAWEAAGVELLD